MKFQNIFKSSLIIFIALFSFSCNNLFDDIGGPDARPASQAAAGRYVTFTGNVQSDGALPQEIASELQKINSNTDARSALPSIDDSNTEYFATAVNKNNSDDNKVSGVFNADKKGIFAITLETGKTWIITAGIKKKNSETIIFSDKYETTLSTENPVLNHTFVPKPVTEGTGSIELKMSVPNGTKVTAECSDSGWSDAAPSVNTTLVVGDGFKATLNASSINTGAYTVVLNFYDENDILKYTTVQAINVFAGLTTNSWRSNGSTNSPINDTDGSFTLTDAIIKNFERTIFYVGSTEVGNINVDEDGKDLGTGGAYSPLASLSRALDIIEFLDNANNNYKIFVTGKQTGTQTISSELNSKAKSITIEGLRGLSSSIPQDIFDAEGSGSVFTIETSVPITFKNIKITGGNGANGGGIKMKSGTKVTLADGVLLTDNKCPLGDGGGIYCDSGSSLTLCGTAKVSKNRGKGSGGGIAMSGTTLIIKDEATIEENEVTGSGWGGGICANGSTNSITISGNAKFIKNEGIEGGAIDAIGCSSITISGGTFSGNTATEGGGIRCWGTPLTMTGGTFENNSATEGGALCLRTTTNNTHSISGSVYIPYGVNGVKGAGKNDIYLGEDRFVTVAGSLPKHSSSNPIAITAAWARGVVLAKAGSPITDLTSYKDYFTLTNSENWNVTLSADKKQITLDAPIYVSTSGSNAATTKGTKNDPFRTIQYAISTALTDTNVDYTILIDGELRATTVNNNGTINGYAQEISDPGEPAGSTIKAKSITIRGASASNGNPTDVINGLSDDGTKRARGLNIDTKIPVTIENLKITGGLADDGGGIYLSVKVTTLTLGNDVLITGNKAKNSGGGIYLNKNTINNSCPTLNIKGNVKICDNTNSVSGDPSNLYLPNGAKITVTGALTKKSDMAKIGVSTEIDPTSETAVTVTSGYNSYNAGVNPGVYFRGDKYGVKEGSGDAAGEAVISPSGGALIVEPLYKNIQIKANKTSFSKAALPKTINFTAVAIADDGTEIDSPLTIAASGDNNVVISAKLSYHGESVKSDFYSVGTGSLELKSGLAFGDYTIYVSASYKGRSYSANFPIVIRETVGTKSSSQEKAVGDIVFNDGSAMPYTEYAALDDDSKNDLKTKAIALIFYNGTGLNSGSDTTTKRTLGMGLGCGEQLPWCSDSSSSRNKRITPISCYATGGRPPNTEFTTTGQDDRNGSDNLEQIADFLGTDDDTSTEENYPALYWAKNYKDCILPGESSSRIKAGSAFENGWYLPSSAELYMFWKNGIYENAELDLNTVSQALGGIDFTNKMFMTSSQATSPDCVDALALTIYAGNTDIMVGAKDGSLNPGYPIAIREF